MTDLQTALTNLATHAQSMITSSTSISTAANKAMGWVQKLLADPPVNGNAAATHWYREAEDWLVDILDDAVALTGTSTNLQVKAGSVPKDDSDTADLMLDEAAILVKDAEALCTKIDRSAYFASLWLAHAAAQPIIGGDADAARRTEGARSRVDEIRTLAGVTTDTAVGAASNVFDAKLAVAVGAAVPKPEPILSVVEIDALYAEVTEDEPGAKAVFEVTRTDEDLTQSCAVNWTASGTSSPADFAPGTAFEGNLAWEAGDGAPKTIEFPITPDKIDEPNETLIVTLADPVRCTLGVATVGILIKDDDEPPVPPTDGPEEPTPPRFDGKVRRAGTARDAQLAIDNSADGDRVILEPGTDAGTLRVDRSISISIEAAEACFASLDCRPRFDLGLRKASASDTGPSKLVVKGLLPTGDRAQAGFNVAGNVKNLRLFGIYVPRGRWLDLSAGLKGGLWYERMKFDPHEGRHIQIGNYGAGPLWVVEKDVWHWADPNLKPSDGTSNQYVDYGIQCYVCPRFVSINSLYEGAFNHGISWKAKVATGTAASYLQRVMFMSYAVRGTNMSQAQLGQQADNYMNGKSGDCTVGFGRLLDCTFIDYERIHSIGGSSNDERLSLRGFRMQNMEGAEVAGCVFYPELDHSIRAYGGDFQTSADVGRKPWSKGLSVHDNEFHGRPPISLEGCKAGYAKLKANFANNRTPDGLIPLYNSGNHDVALGPNSGMKLV